MKKRVHALEKSVEMVDMIQNQLKFVNPDIYSLMQLLAQEDNLNHLSYINMCNQYMADGEDFESSWKKAITRSSDSLTKEDTYILTAFGSQLGKTDLDGQINNCILYKERLEYQLDRARIKQNKYGKLYIKLSLMCGLLLFIIFF